MKYYYLAASLPSLEFPNMPLDSFSDLIEAFYMNTSKKDQQQLTSLRLFIDISNIRPLFLAEEIDRQGNLSEKDLEEALLHQMILPQYVFDFLESHKTLDEKLKYFPVLLAQFFLKEAEHATGFLRAFFQFEREWRLVLLALRAKSMHRDVVQELQFEDPLDPLVLHILMQKDAAVYEPPEEYKALKELFFAHLGDPLMQYNALAEYRFMHVREMVDESAFSVDRILAYLTQVMLLEHKNRLDTMRGKMILDTFKTS